MNAGDVVEIPARRPRGGPRHGAGQRGTFGPRRGKLDQAAAYPFMTPVFGEGVVFDDTSPEERSKALHNQAPRRPHEAAARHHHPQRGGAMIANRGERGRDRLLEFSVS